MKADFINPFIQGSQSILRSVCNLETSLGKVCLKNKPYTGEVFVAIDIIGDSQGKVIYSMTNDTACSVASMMMMGMPVPALDDMSKSALCELSNMISGNVATIFSGIGKKIDIKSPCFNDNSDFISYDKILSVPLNINNSGDFEINIWIDGE